ncbi:MAG: 30S ribosomal protein S18 [Candidatus Woykebacteria bacterium RIFCSPHIGHO2_12_FULL_43_10]|uniref:Small ribosomal subunit protein bS18 n=2 Tax=Candidatus Woykeibacteriota TaxID=1817899 RepID=A0A1G1WWB7_9BACT|nr:MAG: 30S ribosomal protein S18 [Candidatus Woykebacteria bacterium RIFCSPHIGHO2_01_FULL_43_29]OGY28630.1 MAG: 30S ribosomal protein S18 [Candidatus Woykebacteria bacterium RIFCSPHIGHO2_12_FULL_43_10]OGY29980.1 MAG: 30S ribosomal protein S18 [Candidatus Woykebacteria bacterium RIFCSPHIGHO2_02_FULL_43_16b]OGY32032.1 MAG: 30S ribosomal protein S18 [Candidatus Woykebacteria bacterium RIFCSPLOWO2_01_FULL_43_14]
MRRRPCYYCAEKTVPDYKEVALMRKFVTERGKIVPRLRSGVCAIHQRRLAVAIKRARQLALMQFAPKV